LATQSEAEKGAREKLEKGRKRGGELWLGPKIACLPVATTGPDHHKHKAAKGT